jgi:hypothetical protein
MKHTVCVFIEENYVECYPNIRHLIKAHPVMSYLYALKLLKKTPLVKRKAFTIAVRSIEWKTKRNFNKENGSEW